MPRVSADIKEATRARLLAAAAEDSDASAWNGPASTRSRSRRVSPRTIYNYFSSKEEFLAVVEEASAQATASGSAPETAGARSGSRQRSRDSALGPAEHDPFARVLVRECLMGTPVSTRG